MKALCLEGVRAEIYAGGRQERDERRDGVYAILCWGVDGDGWAAGRGASAKGRVLQPGQGRPCRPPTPFPAAAMGCRPLSGCPEPLVLCLIVGVPSLSALGACPSPHGVCGLCVCRKSRCRCARSSNGSKYPAGVRSLQHPHPLPRNRNFARDFGGGVGGGGRGRLPRRLGTDRLGREEAREGDGY